MSNKNNIIYDFIKDNINFFTNNIVNLDDVNLHHFIIHNDKINDCLDAIYKLNRDTFQIILEWILQNSNFLNFFNSDNDEQQLDLLLQYIWNNSCVPHFNNKDDVPFEIGDFNKFAFSIKAGLQNLLVIYNTLLKLNFNSKKRNYCHYVIILLSLEHSSKQLWTNYETIQLSESLMKHIWQESKCANLSEYFQISSNKIVLKKILSMLLEKLNKSNWKQNPSAPIIFSIILTSIHWSILGDYLHVVMPPTLLFNDDFEIKYRLLGLQCIDYILHNVSKTEISRNNYSKVIYSCLKKALYMPKSEELLDLLLKCLLKSQKLCENEAFSIESEQDVLLRILLQFAALEDKIVIRRLFIKYIAEFVELMGIRVAKHLEQLLFLVENYLEMNDGVQEISRLNALLVLNFTMRLTSNLARFNATRITKFLIKLIHDISFSTYSILADVRDSIIEQIASCFKNIQVSVTEIDIIFTLNKLLLMNFSDQFNYNITLVINKLS